MRLELTRRTDLALRALLELSSAQRRTKGAELADRVGTTSGFLAQALTPLVERQWIVSEPGPTGGYSLAVGLDELSVLDLIEASEGATDTGRCVLVGDDCPVEDPCALHGAWTRARAALTAELSGTPIAEVQHRDLPGATRSQRKTETTP